MNYFCKVNHLAEINIEFNLDVCRNTEIVITHQTNGSSGVAKMSCLRQKPRPDASENGLTPL